MPNEAILDLNLDHRIREPVQNNSTVIHRVFVFLFRERLCVAWCGAMAHLAATDTEAMVFSVKSAGPTRAVESIDALDVLSMLVTALRCPKLIP